MTTQQQILLLQRQLEQLQQQQHQQLKQHQQLQQLQLHMQHQQHQQSRVTRQQSQFTEMQQVWQNRIENSTKTKGSQHNQHNLSHFDMLAPEIKQRLVLNASVPPFVPKEVLRLLMELHKLEKTLTHQNTYVFNFVDQIVASHEAKNRSTENEDKLEQRRTLNKIQVAMLSVMQELTNRDPDGERWVTHGSAVAPGGGSKGRFRAGSGAISGADSESAFGAGSGAISGADSKGTGSASRPVFESAPEMAPDPRFRSGSKGKIRAGSRSGAISGADSKGKFRAGSSSGSSPGADSAPEPEPNLRSAEWYDMTTDHGIVTGAGSGAGSGSD